MPSPPDFRALIIKNGTTQNISNADTLIVGTKVDAAAGQALSIGDVNATGITIGQVSPFTTTFPGDVDIQGNINTIGGTTFTDDVTFEGNTTFGAGAADTVTFALSTTVIGDINFAGGSPTYKITNLANGGPNPNDAVNYSQLSALVVGVSSFQTSLSGLTPSSATGGAITLAGTLGVTSGGTGATSLTSGSLLTGNGVGTVAEIAPGAEGNVLTVVSGAWAAAAPAVTVTAQGGANAIQYANAAIPTDFDGNANFVYDEATGFMGVGLASPSEVLSVNGRVAIAETTVPTDTAGYGKLWAESTDKALHFYDNSIDYLVTPNTVDSLSYVASLPLDFAPSLPPLKSVSLTGDITFTTTGLGASRNISVRVVGDTVSRNLVFPAGWTWLGGSIPTVLEANKTAILSLAAFSGANTGVIASWSYDGSIVVTSVTASSPLLSSGGTTPNLSITAGTTSGELLTWNGSAWVAAAPATSGTVTSVTLAASTTGLTISGAASQTITSSGTFTLGGTLAVANGGTGTSTAFTAGSVVFAGASGVYAQDNANLFWDNANDRLGVGIAVPTASLHVAGTVLAKNATNSTTAFQVQNAAGSVLFDVDTTNARVGIGAVPAAHSFEIYNTFAVAAGGRIHTYDGTDPANGQILIGDGSVGVKNFAKATLGAGTNIAITNGAGSISIGLTGQVAVANGGTGAASITAGSLVVGNATSPVNEIAPGSEGDVLTVVGGAWASAAVPAATDYSVVTIATAQAANTAVTVLGAAAQANSGPNARVAGIVFDEAADKVQVLGICTCIIESTITVTGGNVVYLSATEAGKITNVAPSTATQVVAELGFATANGSGVGGTVTVLWQPKSIVVL